MKQILLILFLAFFILPFFCSTISAQISNCLYSDEALEKLDFHSACVYLSHLKLESGPKYSDSVLGQLDILWDKAINEGHESFGSYINTTGCVCTTFEQYQYLIDRMKTLDKIHGLFTPKQKVEIAKAIGIAYNKKGDYLNSMKYLEKGLERALDLDSPRLIRDMYHHIAYEYSYLSLEDSTLLMEFIRIIDKCYYYNLKLDDRATQALDLVTKLINQKDIRYCRHELRKALALIPKNLKSYDYYIQSCLQEYVFSLHRNKCYKECINILEKYHLIDIPDNKSLIIVLYASSYYHLGEIDSAKKYAIWGADRLKDVKDRDELRAPLTYLPNILGGLGMYEDAYLFESIKYMELYRQFVRENIIQSESVRFDQELRVAKKYQKVESKKNYILFFGIGFALVVLSFIIYSIIQFRKKNIIIKRTKTYLANKNTKLEIANKELESFAYASAHDIKNPLHTISAFLQLIALDPKNKISEKSHQHLKNIDMSINNINSLINGILKYAQLNTNEKLEMQKVDLQSVFNEVKIMLHAQISDSNAKIIIPRKLPTVSGVPELLGQVILNIVSNAIKYRRTESDLALIVRFKIDGDKYHIDFQDNGIGIPDKDINKIFELFSRADNTDNKKGVGIGLAVVKKIIRLHGGKISATNNLGFGSTFRISIPKYQEKPLNHESFQSIFDEFRIYDQEKPVSS